MDDVMTTAEAVSLVGRSRLRNQIASGRWQTPERGVVVTHNGPLTPAQGLAVVVAAAPRGSAIGGLTALEVDGLSGFDSAVTHLVVPNGARPPRLQRLQDRHGLVVESHQSIHLALDDVRVIRGPRRTTPARSVIDASSWGPSDRFARTIVIASVQQSLTTTRQIRESLVRRPTQLRRGIVVESILDAAGGIQSLPERDFEELRLRAGLSTPVRQRAVKGADGRYFLDVWFRAERLGVQIHGVPHLAVKNWDADLHRSNEITIGGRRMLYFTSFAVRHEKQRVIDQLRRAAA